MSDNIEETIKLKKLLEKKNNKNKKYLQKLLYCFVFIFILIIIDTIPDINMKKILKLLKDSILNKNKQKDKLKYKNNTSINEMLNSIHNIEIFNQDINDKYIKSQNYFCDNQSIFYNKLFEDKIKLIDIKFNMFVYKDSDAVSNSMIQYKAWEVPETQKLLNALNYFENKKNIKAKDIYIIDIGANIGWYSFIFGKYGYKIISFEPSIINNEEKICDLYSHINNQGDGFIKCEQNQNLSESYKKEGEIILTKLSNYLSFFSNRNLLLIKMDIEGAERKAIDGGIELITKYHIPFIFFEFSPDYIKRLGTEPKELLQLFVDNGYKISILDFFNDYISVDDVMKKKNLNLYIVYSKILE